jgi:predicted RNA binding protein YcfA (HicA-like mRNA interferase family)
VLYLAALPTEPNAAVAMPMKVREVIQLLEEHGWKEMQSKGSHRHFKHPDQRSVITVPGNEGKELASGTLNAILKKAGLK